MQIKHIIYMTYFVFFIPKHFDKFGFESSNILMMRCFNIILINHSIPECSVNLRMS